jgi:molybdopterin/thiamine biosynthesis adenylyltransferase/Zn-dependent protease
MDLAQPEPDSRLILNHETSRYLRLGLREFDWLNRLDGRLTIADVAIEFGQEEAFVAEMLRRMEAAKLICFSDEPVQVQAAQQAEASQLATRRFEWTQFGQLRIHFGQPKALLERLAPFTRPLFSKTSLLASLGLAIVALAAGFSQGTAFVGGVRNFEWGLWHTVAIVALVFGTTLIHELGHAVVCHHFGAPVRSLGIMIYYLQPAAYADVTDSWQLKNRWHRAAISAAGIYVQAVVSSLAVVAWSLLRMAGHRSDLIVMFATFNAAIMIFNALPFAKLDGYWILSNVVGIPNLRDRAMEWARVSVTSVVRRRPVDAAKLKFNAVLAMPPIDRTLLAAFGITATLFGVSMWMGGVSFLLRITRWTGLGQTRGLLTVVAAVILVAAAYVASVVLAGRRAARRRAAAPVARTTSPTAVVTHNIDLNRTIRLNPHLSVVDNEDGTMIFGWSAADSMTVEAPQTIFDVLPLLRDGSFTLQKLRQSPLWTAQTEQIVQRLWHDRHLRYTSDWGVPEENVRYTRQLGWFSMNRHVRGKEGEVQKRLRDASVTVLGVGGLGTHVAWNLAACGIGELHLVDGDTIELTNLNRQLFFTPNDIGQRKVDVCAERLRQFNPSLRIRTTHKYLLTPEDFYDAVKGSSFAVRAVDSPPESIVWLNDVCVPLGIPYTGAGFFAQGTVVGPTVIPWESSCVSCNAPAAAPRFDRGTGGTLAPVVFTTAGLLANEIITYIGKLGTPQTVGRVLSINAPDLGFTFRDVPRNENCPTCGREARKVSA